jgi:hypothetical protein
MHSLASPFVGFFFPLVALGESAGYLPTRAWRGTVCDLRLLVLLLCACWLPRLLLGVHACTSTSHINLTYVPCADVWQGHLLPIVPSNPRCRVGGTVQSSRLYGL